MSDLYFFICDDGVGCWLLWKRSRLAVGRGEGPGVLENEKYHLLVSKGSKYNGRLQQPGFTLIGGNIQRSGWPTCGVSTKSEILVLTNFYLASLHMEPTLVCPAERRQRVPGWSRLSHKLKRSSENGGGHLHVRPSVAPGKWSIHLQNMPLHCIYPSSSPSPSSPVPKSREWVSAISGVEVTPSRDWVFGAGEKTFEIEILQFFSHLTFNQIWASTTFDNVHTTVHQKVLKHLKLPVRWRTVASRQGVTGVVVVPGESYWSTHLGFR